MSSGIDKADGTASSDDQALKLEATGFAVEPGPEENTLVLTRHGSVLTTIRPDLDFTPREETPIDDSDVLYTLLGRMGVEEEAVRFAICKEVRRLVAELRDNEKPE